MALWVARAGKHGEHEQRFIADKRVYLTWDGFDRDLRGFENPLALTETIKSIYPEFSQNKARNHAAQVWTFAKRFAKGDWVIVPSKERPAIHVAELVGPYSFDKKAEDPYYHFYPVKWIAKDVPRSNFDQDLLYSFGAIQTIFGVARNDAERRVRDMAAGDWKRSGTPSAPHEDAVDVEDEDIDLALTAQDQLAKAIIKKFKGHGLERLVEAILKAKGYTTYHSPEGPDKGVDLLAAAGPLGFGHPRICVQVKSGDTPVDSPTLNQLIGAMQNVHADQGLLVAWGGWRSSVSREIPAQFFRVRLWDQRELIEQLLAHYDELDPEIRSELPLKRIWVVAQSDSED